MGEKPHVIVIPYAAQGHVMPLMKLSCCLVDRGFGVTFVNTESIHVKLMDSLLEKEHDLSDIDMVAIPDGLTPYERSSSPRLLIDPPNILLKAFENLVRKVLESSKGEKLACVIADETVGWAIEIAMKMGIRVACFFPASAGVKAVLHKVPELIKQGIIDDNGTALKRETFLLSPAMPEMKPTHLAWYTGHNSLEQKLFQLLLKNAKISESTDWVLCNSSEELEHAAISLVPNLLAVGPLLGNNAFGNLWPEDTTCMEWLNQQVDSSVIYIAFGSHVIFNQHQFDELAFALELLGRPFLWVVRSTEGLTITFPDGFQNRVASFAKIVTWAPQMKVLAHPSIACFLSHCGWNSTTDGVSMGIPFISWPYFADQFTNQTYITDVWKIGLGLNPDGDGIFSRDEIRRKLDQVLGDEMIRANALKLKQTTMSTVSEEGSSLRNFQKFIDELSVSNVSLINISCIASKFKNH